MAGLRTIIHVDMDAFFASVEQRDHPELKGKPIAVGYDGPRGVLATASYEARRYGVHSAMATTTAKRLCPELIIVEGNHHHYSEVSAQVHQIFRDYTDLIEPISIDEAFLDVTVNKKGITSGRDIASEIRRRIREELHLTASAGISYNKFLAKIASDYNKPDGMFEVSYDEAQDFIAKLPVEKFWGVGPKTKARMHKMGIYTGRDLRAVSKMHLLQIFGKAGEIYYDFARGMDERPVVPEWVRKSVGCEETMSEDITMGSQMIIELYHVVLELEQRLAKSSFKGKTLTLKIKYSDFKVVNRSITSSKVLATKADILPLAKSLVSKIDFSVSRPVRLVGLSVSNPPTEKSDGKPRWVQGRLNFGDGFWEDDDELGPT
jgi:DNA polymerase-4